MAGRRRRGRPYRLACQPLQNPCRTRLCPVRRFAPTKNPFDFKGRIFDLANFSKFFLGRNGGNQGVAGEKIWNRRFFGFGGSVCGRAPKSVGNQKHDSTIPFFQKQFVDTLVGGSAQASQLPDSRLADAVAPSEILHDRWDRDAKRAVQLSCM
jgi:hypothetical protein